MATRTLWLKIGVFATIGTGLLIAGSVISGSFSALLALLFDVVFLPLDGSQSIDGDVARLFAAITGGLLVGLGALLWVVVTDVLPGHPMLARKLILVGIGTWFVIDSSMSVAAGAPMNVLFNLGFLLVFVVPAWGISPVPEAADH